jgi:hypothetical protein
MSGEVKLVSEADYSSNQIRLGQCPAQKQQKRQRTEDSLKNRNVLTQDSKVVWALTTGSSQISAFSLSQF